MSTNEKGPRVGLRIVHAYNPQNGPNGDGRVGGEHLAVLADLDVGRLHRKKGDALCKPARKFYSLWDGDCYGYTIERVNCWQSLCPHCSAIALRLGDRVTVPAGLALKEAPHA